MCQLVFEKDNPLNSIHGTFTHCFCFANFICTEFYCNLQISKFKKSKMCVSNAYEYHCMVHLYGFIGWPQKMAGESNFFQQLIHLG